MYNYTALYENQWNYLRSLLEGADLPNQGFTNTRESNVRAIAEYEEMGGVIIAYPGTVKDDKFIQLPPSGPRNFGIPNELIVRMQMADSDMPVHIFLMCHDENQLESVVGELQIEADKLGLTFKKDLIHMILWDTDTYWTRDYCPWWIYNEKTGTYGIANHRYTTLGGGNVGFVEGAEDVVPGPGVHGIFRPNDEYGAVFFSDYINSDIRAWNRKHPEALVHPHEWYDLGLLEVGGNYMVTRKGVIASTYLVATQNELPVDPSVPVQESINNSMQYVIDQFNRFMGLNTYHVLADPTGTYIGHIDCWGKFVSDTTVILASSQDSKIQAKLDAIAEYFRNQGFCVYRILCQNIDVDDPIEGGTTTASYVNCLILNNSVFVPITGDADHDQAALNVFSQALPNYEIHGIIGKTDTPWLGTDSIHCRTRGVPQQVIDNWLQCKTFTPFEYKLKTDSLSENSFTDDNKNVSLLRAVGVDTMVKEKKLHDWAFKDKVVDGHMVKKIDDRTLLYAIPVPSENCYIWASDVPISATDVLNVLNFIRRESQDSTIHINSGTHGDAEGKNVVDGGGRYAEFKFFEEDLENIEKDPHASIHIISSYSPEIYPFAHANHIILAWCYSIRTMARTELVKEYLENPVNESVDIDEPRDLKQVVPNMFVNSFAKNVPLDFIFGASFDQ